MKRVGRLLNEETVTKEFCEQAIMETAIGKCNRREVCLVVNDLSKYANLLRDMVLNDTFEPKPYKIRRIVENGKERTLTISEFFPDQCVHHIVVMLAKKEFLKRIDGNVIASLPDKGIGSGVKKIRRVLKLNQKKKLYCLKGDIKKCYDSVRPEIVIRELKTFIKDTRYISLVSKVLISYPSLPLGIYCSSWFLNVMLRKMDMIGIQDSRCIFYLRYIDDFILISSKRRVLVNAEKEIEKELARLGLRIKGNWQISSVEDRPIDIIGYKFHKNGTVSLRKRNFKKLRRMFLRYANTDRKDYKKFGNKYASALISRMGFAKKTRTNTNIIWKKYFPMVHFDLVKDIASPKKKKNNPLPQ